MTRLLAALAVVTVSVVAHADDKTKPADAKLNGTYTIVSGEEQGKQVPGDRFEGSVVVFTDTTIMGTDKAKKEFFAATYTVDTSKTPWVISMTSEAPAEKKKDATDKKPADDKKPAEKVSTTGLVKVDGDTVTLVYALPGGKAPTEYKTGDKQQMFVLKRKDAKK